ncbi:Dad4p SCDLUD_004577 [Saccharomycodes ludwigii]|uniref:Dad4p n=1 Tax=Saccharomycodes ludwigii TaxID=36035 RepID=UPI001E8B677A|nr:hypothetical protein SCDLUD_004577 [Saccharomycodes ludwigii]KAH3899149.1 hypothetical protein SCDLUD_004577 [Saccharomycodes ludwigii]
MENPHENVQINILHRIVNNMERLNDSILQVNNELHKINICQSNNLQIMGGLMENYHQNIKTMLQDSDTIATVDNVTK